ncbi:sensor domain-containing diguanylate cyclase [Roseiflexus sp.]|uniref:sensor domain-containing diguanylate cyclase n=1 Tax=Roseiflexus sp. TaxID=2562120 RepID=UPI0021DDAB5B|nr:sensor domain-containing diguanylate cyclase [Roseiflexus sp.]GIW00111.1 MAG: diguanylate cyclase [Roseiflexus sp.]
MDDAFYKQLLDEMHDGVYFVDRHRRILYWNRGAERLSGYSADEVIGRFCGDNLLRHVDECGRRLCTGMCPLAATIRDGQPRQAEVIMHHKQGHRVPVLVRVAPIRDKSDAIVGAVEVFSDNTYQKAALEEIERLRELALLDPLTGIGNRRFIESNTHSRLEELRRYGWPFGVILADIDHFKAINDTFGHLVGDDVLKMVAHTLAHNVRAFDAVGRWGGEEFAIVAQNVSAGMLLVLAERLRALVEQSTLFIGARNVHVTISLGAAIAHPDDTPLGLLDRADHLLYQSKQNGRNCVSSEAAPSSVVGAQKDVARMAPTAHKEVCSS